MMNGLKILHLPSPTGGNAWFLAQGEKRSGAISDVMYLGTNRYSYTADMCIDLPHHAHVATKLFKSVMAFLRVRRSYDIYHFNYGSSLIHSPRLFANLIDLPYYPKRSCLFVTYNGCDARQKYPTVAVRKWSACMEKNCYGGQCNSGVLDTQRQRAIQKMAHHVDHIWAVNPDLLNFLPPEKSSFLPYAIAVENFVPEYPAPSGILRIVHAPTDRDAKGTGYVLRAIDGLSRSHPGMFEFALIENVSRDVALTRIANADVLIDQLLVGWYGGVAVEAMLLGKAVIARIEERDLHFIPDDMRAQLQDSLVNADPESLYAMLASCLERRSWLLETARNGFAYARRWHDPAAVAKTTLSAYVDALRRKQCVD